MTALRALLIEDNPMDAALAVRALEQADYCVEWERVESAPELVTALERTTWDIVLSDYNLPGFGALPALQVLKEKSPDTAFIVVSGAVGEETAVEIIKAGAIDFVMKSKLVRLPSVVARSLSAAQARKSEREARASEEQAIRARERLLSIVSHDLKNPLGALQLNLQFIQKILDRPNPALTPEERDQKIRTQLERSLKSADRMKNMIADILDQAKIESGRFAVQCKRENAENLLVEIIEMFQPLAMQKSIQLKSSLTDGSTWADFDYERMFQVLANLAGNAIKFTPAHGKISVGCQAEEELLIFEVKDTGPGIAPEHQRRIFERFWQADEANRQGVGLGLSIAKGIIEAHGGTLGVTSAPGQGSCFSFKLPRWKASVEEVQEGAVSPPAPAEGVVLEDSRRGPILLVEDDDDLRQVIEQVLSSQGYRVHAVPNAEAGLSHLESGSEHPSLVLLDYNLPGMNGAQFVERMLELSSVYRDLPVILSSAERDLSEKARSLSVKSILKKPVSLPDLVAEIRSALG